MGRLEEHKEGIKKTALLLKPKQVFNWMMDHGYFPEPYVLPPCYNVKARPTKMILNYIVVANRRSKSYKVENHNWENISYPKGDYTHRDFSIIHPKIHNDICVILSKNWKSVVNKLIRDDSIVSSYSFPIPGLKHHRASTGISRNGRMIYEFLEMTERDLLSEIHKYDTVVHADIKNFYPSIYTHSIAWAFHGKKRARKDINEFELFGNRLDKLFHYSNDRCTNGIPVGPVVSDVIAEVIASAVDAEFTKMISAANIDIKAARFKDDYRILVNGKGDAARVINFLQQALSLYSLEINEEKTITYEVPDGLFRDWVSRYHLLYPIKKRKISWKNFRELYVGVIDVYEKYPNCNVFDRFLADIVRKNGKIKVEIYDRNAPAFISMLLVLGGMRSRSFPRVLSIFENMYREGDSELKMLIFDAVIRYSDNLSLEVERNQFIIAWLSYFMYSINEKDAVKRIPKPSNKLVRSVISNQSTVFRDCKDFKLFTGCVARSKEIVLHEHLRVFQ